MSRDDFTASRRPVPSGYLGACSIALRIRRGHWLCRAACIALPPRMKSTVKQPSEGERKTIVRALAFRYPAGSGLFHISWPSAVTRSVPRETSMAIWVAVIGKAAVSLSSSTTRPFSTRSRCWPKVMSAWSSLDSRDAERSSEARMWYPARIVTSTYRVAGVASVDLQPTRGASRSAAASADPSIVAPWRGESSTVLFIVMWCVARASNGRVLGQHP